MARRLDFWENSDEPGHLIPAQDFTIKSLESMKIALITYQPLHSTTNLNEDLQLIQYLKNKGLDIAHIIWNDPTIIWNDFQMVILKSPWDYHNQPDIFNSWLSMLTLYGIRILNSASLVRWNSDKHYLQEMKNDGFFTIPCLFLEKKSTPDFDELFIKLNSSRIVVKPCISASAKNTMMLNREDIDTHKEKIKELLISQSLIVQPFMPEIKNGEWSLLFFNGKYSHSVLKIPNDGDFRVQNGTTQVIAASNEMIEIAENFVKKYAIGSLYARVDGIISKGKFTLMELELIEPFLFLQSYTKAMENYYLALMELIN